MKFKTLITALIKVYLGNVRINGLRLRTKLIDHILRHEEKQREDIIELSSLVTDAELNALLDQAEIERLRAQVTASKQIIEHAVLSHIGDSARPHMKAEKPKAENARLRAQLATAKKALEGIQEVTTSWDDAYIIAEDTLKELEGGE